MNICDFKYKRNNYIIQILQLNNKIKYLIFSGDNTYEDIPTKLRSSMNKSDCIFTGMYLEEDDNINQVLRKISIFIKTDPKFIHIYATDAGREQKTINLKYEYFISFGRPVVIKNIDVKTDFFNAQLTKIGRPAFEVYTPVDADGNLNILKNITELHKKHIDEYQLSYFTFDTEYNNYYNNINIILYDDAKTHISKFKMNSRDVMEQFLKLYYPDASEATTNVNFTEYEKEIKHDSDIIKELYKSDDNENLDIEPCNIIEVVIHVNYDNIQEDFVDQLKIFDQFRLTADTPMVRYKGDNVAIAGRFRLYHEMTKEDSPLYLSKKELLDWIVSKKQKVDSNELYISGKGLQYKVFLYEIINPKTNVKTRKYLNFNIYKNGKLEIKCNWSELTGGNFSNVIKAISNVQAVIREINKIDYQILGKSRKLKIAEPDPDFYMKKNSNTKIAFYNVSYHMNLPRIVSLLDFGDYVEKAYDTFVNYIDNKNDNNNSIELRYKRTNGYLKMDMIDSFIFKALQYENIFDDIIKLIEQKFGLSNETAKNYYMRFIDKFTKKKINTDALIGDETDDTKNSKIILNELFNKKNPGTIIKILQRKKNNYKVMILGVAHNTIGAIYYFIKKSINTFLSSNKKIINTIEANDNIFGKKVFGKIDDDDDDEDYSDDSEEDEDQESEINEEKSEINSGQKSDEETGNESSNGDKYAYVLEPDSKNLLRRLKLSNEKLFYIDKYKNNSYSRKCQQDIKKPLVITSRKANIILTKLKFKLANERLDANEEIEIKNTIKLIEEEGRHIKGYFYFCPAKWDVDTYEPVTVNSKNILDKENYTKLAFSNEMCQPCCTTKLIKKKHQRIDKFCMKKFQNDTDENEELDLSDKTMSNKSYILDPPKIFMMPDRYIYLPQMLNDLFNIDKVCKPSAISVKNIECILRHTVEGPNYFLSAIAKVCQITVEKVVMNRLIKFFLSKGGKEAQEIYRILKNGALYNIFMPDVVSDSASSIERGVLSLNEYLNYLKNNIENLNELFLWDLICYPGVLFKSGINMIIIEGEYSIQNILTNVRLKCPTGNDLRRLYDKSRRTLVLYKYKNCYEILCNCNYNSKHVDPGNYLFDSGNKLIENLIDIIIYKCKPLPNTLAKNEYNQYMNNSTHSTIIDRIYDLDNMPLDADTISIAIDKMINNKIYNNVFDDFKIKTQIVDRYNKVRFLICSNNLVIPVTPSPINLNYKIKYTMDYKKSSYENTISNLLILQNFALVKNYEPFAFLIDPGDSLDDPTDDLVIGILLHNGSYINVEHIPVNDAVNTKIKVNRLHWLNYKDIEFDSAKLLFRENTIVENYEIGDKDIYAQYKFDNEAVIDKLLIHDNKIKDVRIIFTTRLNFEEETYERIRYELSKVLQQPDQIDNKNKIYKLINSKEKIHEKRKKIYSLLKTIIKSFIINLVDLTPKQRSLIEKAVGPLDRGFEDIDPSKSDNNIHAYSYMKPIFKKECKNIIPEEVYDINELVHCHNNKLFVNDINLNTGNINNLKNYMKRITEDILRNPLKQKEILEDQIDNSVDKSPIVNNEYLISINNNTGKIISVNELRKEVDKLYDKNITFEDKNNIHYDVKNSENINISYDIFAELGETDQMKLCTGTYYSLPEFWQIKLHNDKFQIYKTQKSSCIFTLIKHAIESQFDSDSYIDDLKKTISNALSNRQDIYREKGDRRELWEIAREAYAEIDSSFEVYTRDEFFEVLKSDEREMNYIDLSIISRILSVRFIILNDPAADKLDINKSGIICMNTTQTLSDKYILLFRNAFGEYSIIHDKGGIKIITLFTEEMLGDTLIYETWKAKCGADYNNFNDKFNKLFDPRRFVNAYEVDDKIQISENNIEMQSGDINSYLSQSYQE